MVFGVNKIVFVCSSREWILHEQKNQTYVSNCTPVFTVPLTRDIHYEQKCLNLETADTYYIGRTVNSLNSERRTLNIYKYRQSC